MRCRLIRDSRKQASWTLTLCIPASILLQLKFAVSGITTPWFSLAPMDPIGFATAFMTTVGPILARKWANKNDGNISSPSIPPG